MRLAFPWLAGYRSHNPLFFIVSFLVVHSTQRSFSQGAKDSTYLINEKVWELPKKFTNWNQYVLNPQAYNATYLHSKDLFTLKRKKIGVGIGQDVVFNRNSFFIPNQQAFRPIQGVPDYPQYIPSAIRPGFSIFNTQNNAATILQFGNFMDRSNPFTNGQLQVGKIWKLH